MQIAVPLLRKKQQVDVLDSVFTQNHVSDITGQSSGFSMYDGGGLAIYGEAQLGVRSSEFSGNSAENGGAMVLRGNHSVSITDSVFDGNVAKHFGGGIALTASAVYISFQGTKFESHLKAQVSYCTGVHAVYVGGVAHACSGVFL